MGFTHEDVDHLRLQFYENLTPNQAQQDHTTLEEEWMRVHRDPRASIQRQINQYLSHLSYSVVPEGSNTDLLIGLLLGFIFSLFMLLWVRALLYFNANK